MEYYWQGLEGPLTRLGDIRVFIFFLALIIAYVRVGCSQSVKMSIWVLMIFNGMMNLLSIYLKDAGNDTSMHLWYLSFSVFNMLAVLTLWSIHKRMNLQFGDLSKIVFSSFTMLFLIQMLRYTDRVILGTEQLELFYRSSVLGVNLAVVPFLYTSIFPKVKTDNISKSLC